MYATNKMYICPQISYRSTHAAKLTVGVNTQEIQRNVNKLSYYSEAVTFISTSKSLRKIPLFIYETKQKKTLSFPWILLGRSGKNPLSKYYPLSVCLMPYFGELLNKIRVETGYNMWEKHFLFQGLHWIKFLHRFSRTARDSARRDQCVMRFAVANTSGSQLLNSVLVSFNIPVKLQQSSALPLETHKRRKILVKTAIIES